jgi:prepilin-type N-terminal cleavage/methylation domain-containing protein
MKKAFTMVELIFVIIVMGILAVTIIPRVKTNPLQEAAVQLVSDIRYTQHLALIDDKYNTANLAKANQDEWPKGHWQVVFSFDSEYANHKPAYTIFSDAASYGGDASSGEIAKNPENINQLMTGGYGSGTLDIREDSFVGMKRMNLGKYGVSSVSLNDGCSGAHISFDYLGRPIMGTHTSTSSSHALITSTCRIELSNGTQTVNINIAPETGYISIDF